jgi:mannose-1-phosphate guanylyltransferase
LKGGIIIKEKTRKGKSNVSELQTPNSELFHHTYCIIMAGGKGERFWPLSTNTMPKPFINLTGEKSLIQLTVERALRFVSRERLFIVLGKSHLKIAQKQLPLLSSRQFIVEPAGKDTAPCVGLAAITIKSLDKDAFMVVLPADQYVPDGDTFADAIKDCVKLAADGDYLVTLGIRPTRPETGYGYIFSHRKFPSRHKIASFVAEKFVEKPDAKRALEYLNDGRYYWNAGIFIWKVNTLLSGMERHMPGLYEGLSAMGKALAEKKPKKAETIFKGLERKSIDYGLMEKADNVLMTPAEFRWDDVGTWSSLPRVLAVDDDDNYRRGDTVCVDTKNCVIIGEGAPVIGTVGISDLVVVASRKGILICPQDRVQQVREIVKKLEAQKG